MPGSSFFSLLGQYSLCTLMNARIKTGKIGFPLATAAARSIVESAAKVPLPL